MTLLPESGPVFHWFLPTRGDSDTPGVIPAFGDCNGDGDAKASHFQASAVRIDSSSAPFTFTLRVRNIL